MNRGKPVVVTSHRGIPRSSTFSGMPDPPVGLPPEVARGTGLGLDGRDILPRVRE